jgi:hypothetical protein
LRLGLGLLPAALELKEPLQLLKHNGVDVGCRLGLLHCCDRLRPRPDAAAAVAARRCGAAVRLLLPLLLLQPSLSGYVHHLRLAKGSCITALGC